jgi:tripartite-type tricarboxylate transporter receptor subunit TctC
MFAPKGLAPDKVEKLSAALAAAVRQPEIRERLLAVGLQPTGTTAAELAGIQKADSELWAPAVKASGFTQDK